MDTLDFNQTPIVNNNQPLNPNPKNYDRKLVFADSEFRDSAPTVLKLLLFLVGFLGFQLIGIVATFLFSSLSTDVVFVNALVNLITYSLTAIILFILLSAIGKGRYIKMVFKGLKQGSIYIWAFLLLGFALFLETVLSIVSQSVISALYGDIPSTSLNESSINEILSSSSMYLMIAPIVLLAPLVEEFAYRLGLMDLIGKKNKKVGLIISSLVFGLLHFNGYIYLILIIGDKLPEVINIGEVKETLLIDLSMDELVQGLVVECLNLPIYVFMGMALGMAYLYSGNICSSIIAHMANNGLSIAVTFLGAGYILPEFLTRYASGIVNSNFINFISLIR